MKLKAFSYGILAALGALALESFILIFPSLPMTGALPGWFMPVGVLIEESLVLFLILRLFREITPGKSFFALSLLFGIGFSLPEILLDLANYGFPDKLGFFSYVGLMLIHTASAGIFGYHLARTRRVSYALAIFFVLAYGVHLAYNLSVMADFSIGFALVIPILVISACFLLMRLDARGTPLPED